MRMKKEGYLALMGILMLTALDGCKQADKPAEADWTDGRSQDELLHKRGVTVVLKETAIVLNGAPVYDDAGRPKVEYLIESQEPSERSRTIVKHLDGTTEVLEEEEMEHHYRSHGIYSRPMYNSYYGWHWGRSSSYDSVSPAHFANRGAWVKSRAAAPHMAATFSGGRVSGLHAAPVGGRAGFFGGARGGFGG